MPLYNPPVTSGSLARGFILPTDASFGCAGDGVFNTVSPGTDNGTQMQAAVNHAATNNLPLNLGGKGYYIGRTQLTRTTAGNLTLVGPGEIYWRRGSHAAPFMFAPALGTETTVSAMSNVVNPSGTATPVTRLTVGSTTGFANGDPVIVHCTDDCPMDHVFNQVKRAEMATVVTVSGGAGGFLYLNLCLEYVFTTAVKVIKIDQTSKLRISGGVKFRCVDSISATVASLTPNGGRGIASVMVIGANEPEIEVEVDTAPNRGVFISGCYRAQINAKVWRLRDDTADSAYGYGVSVSGCSRHTNVAVFGGNLRHAFTTNVYPGGSAAWMGGPRDIKVTGDVVRCSASAWDNHIESYDIHYWDISADATAADATGSDQPARYFLQDRAIRTTVTGAKQKGYPNLLYIYPTDPGYNYTNQYVGIIGSGGTAETTALGSTQSLITVAANGSGPAGRMTVEIRDSRIENMGFSLAAAAGVQPPVTRFTNVQFVNCPLMRLNDTTVVSFHRCTRINTGANQEAISITAGGTIQAYHFDAHGTFVGNCIFRKTDASGTATLIHGGCMASVPNVLSSSVGGTFTKVDL